METELFSTVVSAGVRAKSRQCHFLLDKSSGVLEYSDEDLFDDPSGKDFRHWNRHSSSLDARETCSNPAKTVRSWDVRSPLVPG